MLLYDKNGRLIKISKLDFINDKLYYNFIMNSKVNIQNIENDNSNEYTVINKILKLI
jgi:hypothetical protein